MKSYFVITQAGQMPVGFLDSREEADNLINTYIKRSNEPDVVELAVVEPFAPKLNWIKADAETQNWFNDGDEYLCAFKGNNNTHTFEVVRISADGAHLEFIVETADGGISSDMDWSDVDYFHVIKGAAPKKADEE